MYQRNQSMTATSLKWWKDMLHIHKQCFDRHNCLLLGKSRKKRSRPYPKSVIMWGQSEGEKWTLSRGRHRQKRSASLNTSTEEIVARWLPEAPLCQGLLIFCLSWLNAILWKITGIQSIVFNPDISLICSNSELVFSFHFF